MATYITDYITIYNTDGTALYTDEPLQLAKRGDEEFGTGEIFIECTPIGLYTYESRESTTPIQSFEYNIENLLGFEAISNMGQEDKIYVSTTGSRNYFQNDMLEGWNLTPILKSSITNLTGTTWYLNEWVEAGCIANDPASYAGLHSKFNINFTSSDTQYTALEYDLSDGDADYDSCLGVMYIGENGTTTIWPGYGVWENEDYRTFTITGGEDVTNQDLINWLTLNATRVISDLTNTSWYFNETLDACGIGGQGSHIGDLESEWYIDINWYDVHFNQLYFELGSSNNVWFDTVYEDGSIVEEQCFCAAQYEGGGWRYEAFRTITITGGADVENPDLITWITSNATQVEDPHPTHDTNKHCLVFSSPTDFTLEAIEEGYDHMGRDPEMGGVEPWITNKGYWDGILLYSTDGISWGEWGGYGSHTAFEPLSSVNGKLYLRGIGNTYFSVEETMSETVEMASCSYYWQINGEQVSCTGNIETLLDCGKVANGEHPEMASTCFMRLFNGWGDFGGCPALISAPDFLMETIPDMGCYNMFNNCTNLVKAPRITATNIEIEALSGMFSGCTSLNQLPELLATDIPYSAYAAMFSGCSNIKLSTEKTDEYKYEYRIPASGTGTAYTEDEWSASLGGMFAGTGGTFTGTPEINTVYYTSNEIVRAFPAEEEPEETPSGTTITYNGSIIATIQPGESATLHCAGKKMDGEVIVKAAEGGGKTLPKFDGTVVIE